MDCFGAGFVFFFTGRGFSGLGTGTGGFGAGDGGAVTLGGMLDDDNRTLERETYASEEHYDTVTVEEQVLGHFRTGPVKHQVIVGGNWQNIRDSANLYAGDAPPLDVFSPSYGVAIDAPSLITAQGITTNQEGIYGEDQMTWGRLHVQGGVRHDWSRIDTRDVTDDDGFNQADQATTWRAGILYAFDSGLSPCFHYAESFQPTNSLSFNGTPFKPTRGRQFEMGLKYQPRNFNGFFSRWRCTISSKATFWFPTRFISIFTPRLAVCVPAASKSKRMST